jgi:pimeloyl-ACP methyl ester carboxylesterase
VLVEARQIFESAEHSFYRRSFLVRCFEALRSVASESLVYSQGALDAFTLILWIRKTGNVPLLLTEDFIKKNPDFAEHMIQQVLKAPISREAFMRQVNAIMEFDTFDRLPEVKASTLILHGKQDILVPPENGSILAKGIPNARLVHFKNSAHGLIEEREKMMNLILDFLTGY